MSETIVGCKRLCTPRCFKAVGYSLAMQFLLLTVFVYFVNFQLLQPLGWLSKTLGLVFSFYTWFSAVPLLAAVGGYGVILGKLNTAHKKYYQKRVNWLIGTIWRKALFLGAHVLVGLLTAWLYTSFMHADYQSLSYECYGQQCLNRRFAFLIYMGTMAGMYHFFKVHWRHEPAVEIPIIQQANWISIRTLIHTTMYRSLLKSFVPTLFFAAVYWLFGSSINGRVARTLHLDISLDDDSLLQIATDVRLLFYAWLLIAQIVCNMKLMQKFFSIFLGEQMAFPIEQNTMLEAGYNYVTLTDALSCAEVSVVQQLACLYLYNLSVCKEPQRRCDIFALSVPGSHPHNWNALSRQALGLIESFTAEMQTSITSISALRKCPMYQPTQAQPVVLTAEKILMRQYNQMYGIRDMTYELPPSAAGQVPQRPVNPLKQRLESLAAQLHECRERLFGSIPGYMYFFGDVDGAQTLHLLANSQQIGWLCQGLAGICTASLTEDQYGVVQGSLTNILKALLKLKCALDVLNNVNLNGRKFDRNLVNLKSSVKRSLYKICSVFGDYLNDLSLEPEDYRQLHQFVSYQET